MQTSSRQPRSRQRECARHLWLAGPYHLQHACNMLLAAFEFEARNAHNLLRGSGKTGDDLKTADDLQVAITHLCKLRLHINSFL